MPAYPATARKNLLWRVRYDNYNSCHPENIVIAIGINNLISGKDSPENTAEGIIAVANEVRKQFPESRIILLGLFPSGKEQQSKVRTQCDKIHDILQHHRFEKVEYINPTKWFTETDGTMKDGLYGNDYIHFTGEGYKVAATEIAKILCSLDNHPKSNLHIIVSEIKRAASHFQCAALISIISLQIT